jgi:hypothetical protein
MWRSQTNQRISRLVMLSDLSGGWQGAKRKFRRIRRGARRVGRPCLHVTDRSSDCFLICCRPGCETDDAIIDMKPQAVPSTQEVLAGLVERVTYHNAENGFCVLRAKARGHRDLVTVVGHAAAIAAGSGSRPRANGSTTAPTASSSKPSSCGHRPRRRPRASRNTCLPA